MPWLNTAFIAGAIGGISPELARFLVRAQGGHFAVWIEKLLQEPWISILVPVAVSIVILLLLGLLGGIVAHYGNEPNIGKAFMLGIGAPAFILSTVGAIAPANEVVKDTKVQAVSMEVSQPETDILGYLGAMLITAGHAQNLPSQGTPVPQLTFDTQAIAGDCPDCRVVFQDSSGNVLSSEQVGGNSASTIEVPNDATTAILSGVPDANGAQFSLDSLKSSTDGTASETYSLEVTKSRNYINDFRYILGNNAIQPFDLELKAAGVE
ncbi:MAG: hypothetical protein KL839_04680 [Rhizobium sp.]|nr:hypothetical protein [Rhizobium sp.]